MLIVPLKAVANQTAFARLGEQNIAMRIYQKSTGLYIDVENDNVPVITGALCRNRVLTIRQPYLPFVGDLIFVDTQGAEDPEYSGLGERWLLVYLTPDEVVE